MRAPRGVGAVAEVLARWGCVGTSYAGWGIEKRQVWGGVGVRGTRAPPGFWGSVEVLAKRKVGRGARGRG